MGEYEFKCYIVDSVKGGSGKSSFALMLSLALQNAADDGNGPKSMLWDMDMQGSALAKQLFGTSHPGKNGLAETYLNQKILEYYRKNDQPFISFPRFLIGRQEPPRVIIDEDESSHDGSHAGEQLTIAAALADPDIRAREQFRAASRQNYSSQITYSAFRAGLESALKNLERELPCKIEHVVFDMPPNSDGYSDAVPELLLKQHADSCYYFELMTLDRAHIAATMEWFKGFLLDSPYPFPKKFFFVFSNVPDSIFDMQKGTSADGSLQINEIMSAVYNLLKDALASAPTEIRDRIYFAGVKYQNDYLKKCCSTNAVATEDSTVQFDTQLIEPIAFLVGYKDLTVKTKTPYSVELDFDKATSGPDGKSDSGGEIMDPTKRLLNMLTETER